MQNIVFDIERCAMKIASAHNSTKPWYIAMQPYLKELLVESGHIVIHQNEKLVLNGRYIVLETDSIDQPWYLLVNTKTVE